MDNQPRVKRVLLITGLLIVLLVGVFATISIVQSQKHKGMAKISVYLSPPDADVTMDGRQLSAKTVYVSPGNHTFTASRQDFTADTESISATPKGPNDVYLAPTPSGVAGQAWVSANQSQEITRQYYAGINQTRLQSLLSKKYPLVKYLPVDTVNFSISYGVSQKYPNDPTKIAIYVTALQANQPLAVHWIKYKGFDPNNYEIIYETP